MAWIGGLLTLSLPSPGGAFPTTSTPPLVPRSWNGAEYACKCYVGDDCWPVETAWGELNSTVEGNLRVNIPPGAVCHNVRGLCGDHEAGGVANPLVGIRGPSRNSADVRCCVLRGHIG